MVFLPNDALGLILSYYIGFHGNKARTLQKWWNGLVNTWKLRDERKAFYRDYVSQRNGYSALSMYYYHKALQRREQKVGVNVQIIDGDHITKKGCILQTTANFIKVKDTARGVIFWTPRRNAVLG